MSITVPTDCYVSAADALAMVPGIRVCGDRVIVVVSGQQIVYADATTGDTITRASGSFVTDGVQAGDTVTSAGASTAGNNGAFTVAAVAALALTLEANDTLTSETKATGATLTVTRKVTRPSMSDFEIMLKTCAQEINAILSGRGLTIPVTDSTAVARLAPINRNGALFHLIMGRGPTDDLRIAADPYWRQYLQGLKDLREDRYWIGLSISSTLPRFHSGMASGGDYEASNFSRDQKF